MPEEGALPQDLLKFVEEYVLPYPLGHINPRFFAWVNSPAAPMSVIGELLAAGMNSSAAKRMYEQVGFRTVEQQLGIDTA